MADVQDFLGAVYGGSSPYRVAESLHTRTGGNPFFLEELLLVAGGTPVDDLCSVPLPWNLAEIVRERLSTDEAPLVTRARHRELVEEALAHVERSLEGARIGVGAELVSEDLRMAARALGRITGTVDAEDLLDRIFSSFCIGK